MESKNQNNKIKALLFDFGNVLIDIDYEALERSFREIFGDQFDLIYQKLLENHFFKEVERNFYTAEQMVSLLQNFDLEIPVDDFKTAWNSLLLDIPKERLHLLKKLKSKYKIYMLSNTNWVHINEIFSNLQQNYGHNPLFDLFDFFFLSYQMNAIKPEADIYNQVLINTKLKPNEILFFDDLEENISAADKLGISTQQVTKEYGILEFFNENPQYI